MLKSFLYRPWNVHKTILGLKGIVFGTVERLRCVWFYCHDLPASLNHQIRINGIFLLTDSHQGCFGNPLMWSLNTELLNKVWNCRNPRNWFIIQCHTSWFHSTNYPVTSQTVEGCAHVCLSLSQIGLRYATGVSGTADRIQSDGPGPNSKANHGLVMLKWCVVPPFVESKRDEAYSGNAAIGNGPRACVFISICCMCFGARLPPSQLSLQSAHR